MASRADGIRSGRSGGSSGSVVDDDALPAGTRLRIGRYELFERIASGGMATVYFGRLMGSGGFKRAVALKRLHPHLASEKRFAAMLRDEARLASRIRHRSVVPVLDVVEVGEDDHHELLLVMELVEGVALGALLNHLRDRGLVMPLPVIGGIMRGVLAGLRAAHESTDETGAPLDLVHRDVSPANVLIGTDGIARVADFGIAKARGRVQSTDDGRLKGNFAYMAPEQAKRKPVTPRADLYGAGVVMWECITGKRMHPDDEPAAILTRMLYEEPMAPSEVRDVSPEVDALVKKALAKEPDDRFANAVEMSEAVGRVLGTSGPEDVARFLREHMSEELKSLRERIERVESAPVLEEDITGPRLPSSLAAAAAEPSENGGRVTAVVHDISIPPAPKTRSRWVAPAAVIGIAIGAGAFAASRRTEIPPAVATPPSTSDPVVAPLATTAPTTTSASAAAPVASPITTAAAPSSASAASATSAAPAQVASAEPKRPKPAAKPPKPRVEGAPATSSPTPAPPAPPAPAGLEGIPRERE